MIFLENVFPPDVQRVIYKDADQCHSLNSDYRLLQNLNMTNRPLGEVKHCSFYHGYDLHGILQKINKPQWNYYTNNIILLDINKYRSLKYSDYMIAYYQAHVKHYGFDPFVLTQDLQSSAQDLVPIFQLPEEWTWAEAFCDPAKKVNARTIDFQDHAKEDKINIGMRVCPDYR